MKLDIEFLKKAAPVTGIAIALTSLSFFFGDLRRQLKVLDDSTAEVSRKYEIVRDKMDEKADKRDISEVREKTSLNDSRLTSHSLRLQRIEDKEKQ